MRRKKVGKGILSDLLGGIGKFGKTGFASIGLGKRRVARRRKVGGNGVLSKLNELAKETQIVSKGLSKFGLNPLGLKDIASTLGYGKRRVARRRKVGGNFFTPFGSPLLYAIEKGIRGNGKKRVTRRKSGKGILSSLLGGIGNFGKASLSSIGLGKRRVARRKSGKGILSSLLGGIGNFGKAGLSSIGLGKRRMTRRRKVGGNGVLSKLNELAKETQIVSKGLSKFGLNPLGLKDIASTLGYGKKRSSRKRGGQSMIRSQVMTYNHGLI